MNESLLTGEPVPVRKIPWDGSQPVERPGGENLPFVFSGTMVVQGQGIAEVHATGIRTEIGKIGRALQTIPRGSGNLFFFRYCEYSLV